MKWLACWGALGVVGAGLMAPAAMAGAASGAPTVSISPSVQAITPGAAFSYLIEVTAPDDAEMTAADLTVSVPSGSDVTGLPGACDGDGRTVNCEFGTIAAGGTQSVAVRLVMNSDQDQGTATAGAQLECAECAQAVPASVTIPVNPQADLALALDAPDTIAAGKAADYLLHVENLGPSTASGITIVDRLPAPLRFAGGEGCSADGERVVCRVDELAPGHRLTRALQVTAPDDLGATRQIQDTATATAQTPDPDEDNNADTASSTLRDDARLITSIRTSAAAITPGAPFTYTADVHNLGPSPAKNVRLEGRLPRGVRPTAVEKPASGCTLKTGTVSCSIGELAEGARAGVVIRAEPDPAMPAGQAAGTVIVSCADCGPAHQVKTDRRVRPEADLNVTAAVNHGQLGPGGKAVYTVSLTNKGPSTATELKALDSLPRGLSFVSAPGCTAAGQNITCALDRLAPGQSRSWQITARADDKIDQKVSLVDRVHATMAGSIHDPDPLTENAAVTTVEEPDKTWKLWVIGGAVIAGLAGIAALVIRHRRSTTAHDRSPGI